MSKEVGGFNNRNSNSNTYKRGNLSERLFSDNYLEKIEKTIESRNAVLSQSRENLSEKFISATKKSKESTFAVLSLADKSIDAVLAKYEPKNSTASLNKYQHAENNKKRKADNKNNPENSSNNSVASMDTLVLSNKEIYRKKQNKGQGR